MDKVDSLQEQTDNGSREIEILGRYRKEKLEIENIVMEMKNASEEPTGRLDTAGDRPSELEDFSEKLSTPKSKGKRLKIMEQNIQEPCDSKK